MDHPTSHRDVVSRHRNYHYEGEQVMELAGNVAFMEDNEKCVRSLIGKLVEKELLRGLVLLIVDGRIILQFMLK